MSPKVLAAGLIAAGIAVILWVETNIRQRIVLESATEPASEVVADAAKTTGEAPAETADAMTETGTASAERVAEIAPPPPPEPEGDAASQETPAEVVETAGAADSVPQDPAIEETADPAETAASAASEEAGAPDPDEQPAETASEDTDPPPTAETTETATSEPEARTSTAAEMLTALELVQNEGGPYRAARAQLIEAGWEPRIAPAWERDAPRDENETALVEAGFPELENCETASRTICRFEFLGPGGKIAAILASGEGENPRVIDAFVMAID